MLSSTSTIREISGADVLGRASTQLDTVTSLKIAMGAEYARKIRAEAGDVSKMERRKHQITSLYHQAKMAELEMLDARASGQKSKAETARKYGW